MKKTLYLALILLIVSASIVLKPAVASEFDNGTSIRVTNDWCDDDIIALPNCYTAHIQGLSEIFILEALKMVPIVGQIGGFVIDLAEEKYEDIAINLVTNVPIKGIKADMIDEYINLFEQKKNLLKTKNLSKQQIDQIVDLEGKLISSRESIKELRYLETTLKMSGDAKDFETLMDISFTYLLKENKISNEELILLMLNKAIEGSNIKYDSLTKKNYLNFSKYISLRSVYENEHNRMVEKTQDTDIEMLNEIIEDFNDFIEDVEAERTPNSKHQADFYYYLVENNLSIPDFILYENSNRILQDQIEEISQTLNELELQLEDADTFPEKLKVPSYKEWIITFNSPLKESINLKEHVYVIDSKGNKLPSIEVEMNHTREKVIVRNPVYYDDGQSYYLYIGKDIESHKGQKRKKATSMKFTIDDSSNYKKLHEVQMLSVEGNRFDVALFAENNQFNFSGDSDQWDRSLSSSFKIGIKSGFDDSWKLQPVNIFGDRNEGTMYNNQILNLANMFYKISSDFTGQPDLLAVNQWGSSLYGTGYYFMIKHNQLVPIKIHYKDDEQLRNGISLYSKGIEPNGYLSFKNSDYDNTNFEWIHYDWTLDIANAIFIEETAQNSDSNTVYIPDEYLKNKLKSLLGVKTDEITKEDMLRLSNLILDSRVQDLTGLEYATNLLNLHIAFTKDLSEYKGLTSLSKLKNLAYLDLTKSLKNIHDLKYFNFNKLQVLKIGSNNLSDITLLSTLNLSKLEALVLYHNQISDISVLKELPNLRSVDLKKNQISDLTTLSTMTNLIELNLANNQIHDISALSNLTNLFELNVSENQITNIQSVERMTKLAYLYLSNNQIREISPIQNLTNLIYALNLSDNLIQDISPLGNLVRLTNLTLDNNDIQDIRVLNEMPNLTTVYLYNLPSRDQTVIEQLKNRGVTVRYRE